VIPVTFPTKLSLSDKVSERLLNNNHKVSVANIGPMIGNKRAPQTSLWWALALLWFAGIALRLTILAIPPVVAMIRDEFDLNATQVGLLGNIAPALFAIAALAGSLLVARLGIKGAMVGGLALIAAGSALRGVSSDYVFLCTMTILMAAGVAIMQPIMPTAVRQWLPHRIGLGTAIYTNGLLMGEIFPVMLTSSLILPLVAHSWRFSLVAWSAPIAIFAVLIYFWAPSAQITASKKSEVPRKWLPDWHLGLVWRLGMLFCCINTIYFSANAYLPIYLSSEGRADLISSALTALNFAQLPSSLLILMVAQKLERRAWVYVVSGAVSLVCVLGLVTMVGPLTVFWAGLLGFSDSAALIVGLTLPPLLCHSDDTARTSAGTFTISYAGAVVLALIGGAMWDVSASPALAFVPMALSAVGLIAVSLHLRGKDELV